MKDKRFWSGSKRRYYSSISVVLKDAIKFASFWTCFVLLFFTVLSFLINSKMSMGNVLSVFLLLVCIFLLAMGIFLFENYFIQQRIIKSVISLLPEGYKIIYIEYRESNSQYLISIIYNHKSYIARVESPNLWITEEGVKGSLGSLRMTNKNHDNKEHIHKFMNYK